MSQDEAAKALGISRWTLNRIETGNYKPSWQLTHRLHRSTGLPLHMLNADIFPTQQKEMGGEQSDLSDIF